MRYGAAGECGWETFAPGALHWPENGIRIDIEHGSSPARGRLSPPIMRALPVEVDGEIRIESPLPDTTAARDLAALMRADPPAFTGASVEFRAERESRNAAGQRVIARALLVGAALTEAPSYRDTAVEVRGQRNGRRRLWL